MAMNSEELAMLRESLRALLDEIAPPEVVRGWDRADYLPPELLARFGELGITALAVDEEYGGLGRDINALLMVMQEILPGAEGMEYMVPFLRPEAGE